MTADRARHPARRLLWLLWALVVAALIVVAVFTVDTAARPCPPPGCQVRP